MCGTTHSIHFHFCDRPCCCSFAVAVIVAIVLAPCNNVMIIGVLQTCILHFCVLKYISITSGGVFRYPVVESQRVSDILAEEYAEAVCRRAEELVTELRDTSSPLDSSLLRLTLHFSFLYVMPGFYVVTFSRSCTFAVLNI